MGVDYNIVLGEIKWLAYAVELPGKWLQHWLMAG